MFLICLPCVDSRRNKVTDVLIILGEGGLPIIVSVIDPSPSFGKERIFPAFHGLYFDNIVLASQNGAFCKLCFIGDIGTSVNLEGERIFSVLKIDLEVFKILFGRLQFTCKKSKGSRAFGKREALSVFCKVRFLCRKECVGIIRELLSSRIRNLLYFIMEIQIAEKKAISFTLFIEFHLFGDDISVPSIRRLKVAEAIFSAAKIPALCLNAL